LNASFLIDDLSEKTDAELRALVAELTDQKSFLDAKLNLVKSDLDERENGAINLNQMNLDL
jgi:hypothetical protein